MRLLHTSDWHLGKVLYGSSLLEDQAYILDQIISLIRDLKVKVMVVSGDVFDRSTPSPEAVRVLEQALSSIILDCKCQVVLMEGQHDRLERLGFASRLLRERGLHVISTLAQCLTPLSVEEVDLWTIPYLEAKAVRAFTRREDVHDSLGACRVMLEHIHTLLPNKAKRRALFCYGLVEGVKPAGSERRLAPANTAPLARKLLEPFLYSGLGYVHHPLELKASSVRYAGSPLKYSFAEANTNKSIVVVDFAPDSVRVELFPLSPRHEVRRLEGTVKKLLTGTHGGARGDYISVVSSDRELTVEEAEELRERFPNLLHLEGPPLDDQDWDLRHLEPVELFSQFFQDVTGTELEADLREVIHQLAQSEDE
ncbi:MAG: exonuclease SbcCD subunit D [Candidatus Eremiobacteraeota bacterium]|nr:exonuclease SbcCD subunit D [Candidatus Eremiobacteraeota bacterium]